MDNFVQKPLMKHVLDFVGGSDTVKEHSERHISAE